MVPVVDFVTPDLAALKKEYLVADMHFHTAYSHDCNTPVKKIIARAKALDIYVAITDHNRIRGVIDAHKTAEGRKRIIPGIEVTTKENKDILLWFYELKDLVRFYEKKILPHMKMKSSLRSNKTKITMIELLLDAADEHCVIAIPHPFASSIKNSYRFFRKRTELFQYIHAIEAINETMNHRANLSSLGWAVHHRKTTTAGSDGHSLNRMGMAVTAAKAKNKTELLNAIKAGRVHITGQEITVPKRIVVGLHLLREKARIRINKKLDHS